MIRLPGNVSAHHLFNAPKPHDSKRKRPKTVEEKHFPEKTPLPLNFKRKHFYKNCQICIKKKTKLENKHSTDANNGIYPCVQGLLASKNFIVSIPPRKNKLRKFVV